MTRTPLRTLLAGAVLGAAGTLAWAAAHAVSLRWAGALGNSHAALHAHAAPAHSHVQGHERARGQLVDAAALAQAHGYLAPLAAVSLAVLLLALLALALHRPRTIAAGSGPPPVPRSALLLGAASGLAFAAVETAEHLAVTASLPSRALLLCGLLVHGVLGACAPLLARAAVLRLGAAQAVPTPVLPAARRRQRTPHRLRLSRRRAGRPCIGRAPPLRSGPCVLPTSSRAAPG